MVEKEFCHESHELTQITSSQEKEITKPLKIKNKDTKKNFYAYAKTFPLNKRKVRMELLIILSQRK